MRPRPRAQPGAYLLDFIADTAKQKGTGKWTSQDAMDLGVPTPTIDAAVTSRYVSALKDERVAAADLLGTPAGRVPDGDPEEVVEVMGDALLAAFLVTYAQGFALLKRASDAYEFDLDLETVARVWRGGCIIRADLLETFREAFRADADLANLLGRSDRRRQARRPPRARSAGPSCSRPRPASRRRRSRRRSATSTPTAAPGSRPTWSPPSATTSAPTRSSGPTPRARSTSSGSRPGCRGGNGPKGDWERAVSVWPSRLAASPLLIPRPLVPRSPPRCTSPTPSSWCCSAPPATWPTASSSRPSTTCTARGTLPPEVDVVGVDLQEMADDSFTSFACDAADSLGRFFPKDADAENWADVRRAAGLRPGRRDRAGHVQGGSKRSWPRWRPTASAPTACSTSPSPRSWSGPSCPGLAKAGLLGEPPVRPVRRREAVRPRPGKRPRARPACWSSTPTRARSTASTTTWARRPSRTCWPSGRAGTACPSAGCTGSAPPAPRPRR